MWGKFLDGVDADGLLRSYVCLLEDLLAEADAVCVGDKAAQLTYVCTGGPPPMNYIKKLHPMMEANYPERLAKTIIYPVPWAMRIVVNSFRVLLLIIPWPFFQAILHTCWECYDFEAAVAQEIGHLLGLGHPDLVPHETIGGFPQTGRNSYLLGPPLNSSTCLTPWAYVQPGIPSGAERDPLTGVRPSIMSALTKHNARSCITEDDLEALNVLYPDCSGALTTPVCDKSALNLGWMRMWLYVCIPYVVALATAALAWYCAARKLGKVEPLCSALSERMRPARRAPVSSTFTSVAAPDYESATAMETQATGDDPAPEAEVAPPEPKVTL